MRSTGTKRIRRTTAAALSALVLAALLTGCDKGGSYGAGPADATNRQPTAATQAVPAATTQAAPAPTMAEPGGGYGY